MEDNDYVLGTRDDEIERLGLQHRVWRRLMLDGWHRAGIGPGQIVIDVGAGPGFATTDLAEMVGPAGRVIAIERSPRFVAALGQRAGRLGLANIEARALDACEGGFGESVADACWCRWLLSFVAAPQRTVAAVAAALKPGGVAIFHEYADYRSWRMMPPNQDLDRFTDLVMRSWRDSGGEPDIALHLPTWLAAEGMETVSARPLIEMVGPADFTWAWPAAFMATNAARLHELGYVDGQEADRLAHALDDPPPHSLMITPMVAEIIARKL